MTDNQNSARRMVPDYAGDCAVHTLKELGGRFAAVEIIIFDVAALRIAASFDPRSNLPELRSRSSGSDSTRLLAATITAVSLLRANVLE